MQHSRVYCTVRACRHPRYASSWPTSRRFQAIWRTTGSSWKTAITTAARVGAHWIVTSELIIPGYTFADRIGTAWIQPQPDPWMKHVGQLAARLGMTVFLSHPEEDRRSKALYNSVFVIAADETITGAHRKINTLRVGSESWSSPGEDAVPVPVHPLGNVGILICAGAFAPGIAGSLKTQGTRMLVSSAAWAPGLHGLEWWVGAWHERL
ncbi:MAG: carbon-nitrogen hydrolase family protein [Nitrospirales bacterium]